MENTESKSTIKNSWSLLTFARQFGTHLEAGKCTSPETGEYGACRFTDNDGKSTFVTFSRNLPNDLTANDIASQANELRVVELEVDKETWQRRIQRAQETGRPVQMQTYKLCRRGESSWTSVDITLA